MWLKIVCILGLVCAIPLVTLGLIGVAEGHYIAIAPTMYFAYGIYIFVQRLRGQIPWPYSR
jgi:hypothetical protein